MRVTLISIILVLCMYAAHAQEFDLSPTSETIDITFDSPRGTRGWSDPYIRDFEISVTNEVNATLKVNVNPSSNDGSFIRLSSSASTLTIPPLGSDSVIISVKIVDSAADGGVYTGRVRLASGSQSENVDVRVRTKWPPPTLGLSGSLNFGEVTTGQSYIRSYTLREELRFYDARNVVVKLNPDGPVQAVTTSPSSFPLIDGTGKTIVFGFSVKERGIVPGTYRPRIDVTSSNRADLIDDNLVYTIPRPLVEVSYPVSKIIFDYGRSGTEHQEITITETGGKTPVENTLISFQSLDKEVRGKREDYGQPPWFTFPTRLDYIPPGGFENITVTLTKPIDAPVGNYVWEGAVQTKYAGDEPFEISFAVIPPGVRELLRDVRLLRTDPHIMNHLQMEQVRHSTESLLLEEFFEDGMADIENVTLLTNSVIKFLNSMSAAHGEYDRNSYNEAYAGLRSGKEEFDTMDSIHLIANYRQENNEIIHSAEAGWTEFARLLAGGLEVNATEYENLSNPDASYYESREAHKKIAEICTWLNDSTCVQAQIDTIRDLNEIIKQLIAEAHEMEKEAGVVHSDIFNNTWNFLGIRMISNPFRFRTVWEQYNAMITMYHTISWKYQLSGELVEREKTKERLNALKKETFWYKFVNSIYIILLISILIRTIGKSINGVLRYRADANDMRLAEITRLKESA